MEIENDINERNLHFHRYIKQKFNYNTWSYCRIIFSYKEKNIHCGQQNYRVYDNDNL